MMGWAMICMVWSQSSSGVAMPSSVVITLLNITKLDCILGSKSENAGF